MHRYPLPARVYPQKGDVTHVPLSTSSLVPHGRGGGVYLPVCHPGETIHRSRHCDRRLAPPNRRLLDAAPLVVETQGRDSEDFPTGLGPLLSLRSVSRFPLRPLVRLPLLYQCGQFRGAGDLATCFSFVGAYLLFGERSRPAALASAGIAMAGGMILGWGDFASGGMAWFGDSLALAGAGMVTAYWLMGQNLRTRMSTVTYTLIVYSTAGLLLAGVTLAFGQPLFSYPSRDWWLFFLLALFPTLLGHSLLNWVIRWIPATTVSVAILGEPIGASLLAWIIFSEQPGIFQWIGGLFIIIGVYGFLRYKETSEKPGTAHSQIRQGDSL